MAETKSETTELRSQGLPPEKCWSCAHRGEVPGSAHSSCRHPETSAVHADPIAQLTALIGRRSGITLIQTDASRKLRITASTFGIQNGWFIWPVNFDPTWLETCDGFTASAEAGS